MEKNDTSQCPLCGAAGIKRRIALRNRELLVCNVCYLAWVPSVFHISEEQERRRYDLHQNSRENVGYVNFLQKVVEPVLRNLQPGARGLNYGSGPSPVLSDLLQEKSFEVVNHDPFYALGAEIGDELYDFVVCCETAEHFRDPDIEWKRMERTLQPGGTLISRTSLYSEETDFTRWRYANDETHICFYHKKTICLIAEGNGMFVAEGPDDITVFRKPGAPKGVIPVCAAVIKDGEKIMIARRDNACSTH